MTSLRRTTPASKTSRLTATPYRLKSISSNQRAKIKLYQVLLIKINSRTCNIGQNVIKSRRRCKHFDIKIWTKLYQRYMWTTIASAYPRSNLQTRSSRWYHDSCSKTTQNIENRLSAGPLVLPLYEIDILETTNAFKDYFFRSIFKLNRHN